MNLQQLEYVLAVAQHQHFARAAAHCYVTQPTLSMMIQKLEGELGVQIFDRSRQPVELTREGQAMVVHIRQILADVGRLRDYASELQQHIKGEVRLGVIPTLAPYLLPTLLPRLMSEHPDLKFNVREMVTERLLDAVKSGEIDMGLMATPVEDVRLNSIPLFKEPFVAYVSPLEVAFHKKLLLPEDINPAHLWLLEEGHCLRGQVLHLCALRSKDHSTARLRYESGSLETLVHLVDAQQGITILPLMATRFLGAHQLAQVRNFAEPCPTREITLVTVNNFPRRRLLAAMAEVVKGVYGQYLGK